MELMNWWTFDFSHPPAAILNFSTKHALMVCDSQLEQRPLPANSDWISNFASGISQSGIFFKEVMNWDFGNAPWPLLASIGNRGCAACGWENGQSPICL